MNFRSLSISCLGEKCLWTLDANKSELTELGFALSGDTLLRQEVVKLDTQYISEWSLRLDVKILWKTVWSVLKSDGAM